MESVRVRAERLAGLRYTLPVHFTSFQLRSGSGLRPAGCDLVRLAGVIVL